MADVLVFAAAPVGGSVDPSPDPKFAEVWASAPVGGGVYLVRTGVARLITPSATDADRDFFNDEAELAAYPTSGLVVGDWAKIKGSDELSQVLYEASWNGSSWPVAEAFEQGSLQTDSGMDSTRVELVGGDKARVVFYRSENDFPGFIAAEDRTVEIVTPSNTLDAGQATLALLSAAAAEDSAVKILTAPLHLESDLTGLTVATPVVGVKVYAKDNGGVSALYVKNDVGNEYELGVAGAGVLIAIEDEGVSQGTADTLDFVGSGVSASVAGSTATITVRDYTPVGVIVMTGAATAPSLWLLCRGQAVSRTTYAALFTAIGTAYGVGDGSTTFNVPELQQRFPLGKAASGTGSTLGGSGGAIDHPHAVDPPITTSSAAASQSIAIGLVTIANVAGPNHTHTVDIASFNSGTNNPPYTVVNFLIYAGV